uniref:Tripartite motif-containing protein 16-like n=1 Tax=Mola mola TaxID=94237 RepID=A0A3Q3WYL5_MOLML
MTQTGEKGDTCSICLELLSDPVTIPCGHSYCMRCITVYWDEGNEMKNDRCPQCRQRFLSRPVLMKNTMLAELVEEINKSPPKPGSPHQSYTGLEEVSCDFCTGIKQKALKSCLVCMASFCEEHLTPHYTVAPLKKHMLVDATSKLQENMCSRHEEVKKVFCRTDGQCICFVCTMEDHKGHDTVRIAAERAERQANLGLTQQKIQQRIQNKEKDLKALEQRVESMNLSAEEAVKDTEKISAEMKSLIEERISEVKQQMRSQQQTEASRAKEHEEKLHREITELRTRLAELEVLSCTEDHLRFLISYPSASHQPPLSDSNDVPGIHAHPLYSFKDVAVAVSKARDKVQAALTEEWAHISPKVTEVKAELRTRAEFLKYSCRITLDPNTTHKRLSLSGNNTKAKLLAEQREYFQSQERFAERWQVLSKEGLTGRCYWEVKWSGRVYIAVAYQNISRTGTQHECGFGYNDKSWALICKDNIFKHNNVPTLLSGTLSSRIGVYLDHTAGTLSFYNISETMTLLHRVHATFTQPLHPGFWLAGPAGSTAELCELQ